MRICVGDIEANGLLDSATNIWCGVFKDINTKEVHKFSPLDGDDYLNRMFKFLDSVDVLIMHNGIGYDWPLMEKLYSYSYPGKKVDTLIISRMHNPDRLPPIGYKGRGGPHSVEAWGWRLGRWKPDHDEWDRFSEAMLHRCSEDVEIQHLIYNALEKERKELGGKWKDAYLMTFKLFEVLHKQEQYGWLVDQEHLAKAIRVLDNWIRRIDKALQSRLPYIVDVLETKAKGEYNYVKKPFLKSGKLNDRVLAYWEGNSDIVGGPHSRVTFRKVDLSKGEEVKDFLLASGWVPRKWNTNDDGVQTSPKLDKDDPFEGVEGAMGKLIVKRVQCRQRRGVLVGWRDRLRPDGRLPSRVTGLAVTGRAKHSEIVNVPKADSFFGKWMRKTFSSPEGRVLVGCDAAGCQDRMLAQRAKNQEFTDMLLYGDKDKGTDGHSLAMKGVNRALDKHGLPYINRNKAKNFNFGLVKQPLHTAMCVDNLSNSGELSSRQS